MTKTARFREIQDKRRIDALLAGDPITTLEARDECALGMDGLVTAFATEDDLQERGTRTAPSAFIVRWGQKNLGLGSKALLLTARLSELPDLTASIPLDRGELDTLLPFWASAAITSVFQSEAMGVVAHYAVSKDSLRPSKVTPQCKRLEDLQIIKPMFPKLSKEGPAYVLALKDQLTAVATVTHLLGAHARIGVYTVPNARGRGFGRGVLTAVAEELLALRILPTVTVDLGDEASVRMVEDAGFFQHSCLLRASISGRLEARSTSLVQLRR